MIRFLAILTMVIVLNGLGATSAQQVRDFRLSEINQSEKWGKVSIWKDAQLPNKELASAGMIYHEGKIYLFGGHLGDQHVYENKNFTKDCWVLDLNTKQLEWKPLREKILASVSPGVSFYKGAFYIIGGFRLIDGKFSSNSKIEKYDLASGEWTLLNVELPNRSSGSFASEGNKIYMIGGWNAAKNEYLKDVSVLNLENLELTTHRAVLPAPVRRAVSSLVLDENTILIAGGLLPEKESPNYHRVLNTITAFHPNAQDGKYWEELGTLPFPSTTPALAYHNGQLFVMGGYKGDINKFGSAKEFHSEIYARPLRGNAWENTGLSISEQRAFSRIFSLGNLGIAAFGGYVQNGKEDPIAPGTPGASPSAVVEFFQPR
jgi:N-acetylneuraminic acid mutarotase